MSLTVNTNLEAMNASRNLNQHREHAVAWRCSACPRACASTRPPTTSPATRSAQRLQAQVNGLNQATLNSQDAISLAQTAQGSLNDVAQMLQRIRELAVQYANGTTSEDRQGSDRN